VLVFAVVVMAFGAFLAAEWVEKKIGGKLPDADCLLSPARRDTPIRKFAAVLVGLGLIAAFAGSPYHSDSASSAAPPLTPPPAVGPQSIPPPSAAAPAPSAIPPKPEEQTDCG
jgi:hypothetical protein